MEEKTLQIYFTSDLHAFIYPTDYRGAEERDTLGPLTNAPTAFKKTAIPLS